MIQREERQPDWEALAIEYVNRTEELAASIASGPASVESIVSEFAAMSEAVKLLPHFDAPHLTELNREALRLRRWRAFAWHVSDERMRRGL